MFYNKRKRYPTMPHILRSIALHSFLIVGLFSIPQIDHARAQNKESTALRGSSSVKALEMADGQSETIILPREAKDIFVSDPTIVDAIARDPRTLYIIGKGSGKATIVVSDRDNQEIMTLNLKIGRDLNELRQTLKTAIPTGEIDFNVNNLSIILTGEVENANDAILAEDIAKTFFSGSQWIKGQLQTAQIINSIKIRGKEQVMLKVTIAEVERSVLKSMGLVESKAQYYPTVKNNGSDGVIGKIADLGASAVMGSGGGSFSVTGKNFATQLEAMETNGVAKLLAEPVLVAISGSTAKFKAGGQIPVKADVVNNGGAITQMYVYKDVGVMLEFTPIVLTEGKISLKVKTEVNEIDSYGATGTDVSFKQRLQETTVELPSGASMVTAGLIQSTKRSTIMGTPGLMNLPVIGSLFRSRAYQSKETELMVIVTPYIAKAMPPGKIAKPTDGLEFASDPQAILLGRINKIYGNPKGRRQAINSNRKVGFSVD